MARDRRRERQREREEGKDVIATPRLLPLFFPFSRGFHAKQCFHGAVISFSQRTYSPSWPPVFRLSFPSLATPPLSFEPWLELSVHFPSCNLRPTSRRRPPRENLHRRRRDHVTDADVSDIARNANAQLHVFPPISRLDSNSSFFRLFFHEKGILAKDGGEDRRNK